MAGTAKTPEQKEALRLKILALRAAETPEQRADRISKFKETIKSSSKFQEERSAKISATRKENSEFYRTVAQISCAEKSPEAKEASLANLKLAHKPPIKDKDGNIICRCGCGEVVKQERKNRPQYTIKGHSGRKRSP